jgi:hypothetical protein
VVGYGGGRWEVGKLESSCDLEAWKVLMRLAKQVYQTTEVMPKHEIYGLTSRICRVCVSVPADSLNYIDDSVEWISLCESTGCLLNFLRQSLQREIDN